MPSRDVPGPERGPARQDGFRLADLAGDPTDPLGFVTFLLVGLTLFGLPLAAGGAVGYLIGDVVGAFVGVIGTAVLIVAVKAWREERQKGHPKTGG